MEHKPSFEENDGCKGGPGGGGGWGWRAAAKQF